MSRLFVLLWLCGQLLRIPMPEYLPDGLGFHQAAEMYYSTYPEAVFGYVTRYGPNEKAYDELFYISQEYRAQLTRGYVLLGGGYGYQYIDGVEYLVENRACAGYSLLANKQHEPFAPTQAQQNLYELSFVSYQDFDDYLDEHYVGLVFTRSSNDIGREFCYYSLDEMKVVGKVIVGGSAARNDWLYYGPSLNDYYGHLRLGQRLLHYGDYQIIWIMDVSDSLWVHGKLAALLPAEICECYN